MFNQVIQDAEKILGVPAEVIFREGLKGFLLSKVEENNKIINDLKEKYGAAGYAELEEKIKPGNVPAHPAWEDVILWEELTRHTERLRDLIVRLEAGGAVAS
ncbi:MAG: hypothetical protein K6U74_17940 [Firmicutes bacterium]|nr:hypothetical protein [Bacillota bacterium]